MWLKVTLFLIVPMGIFFVFLSGMLHNKVQSGTSEKVIKEVKGIDIGRVSFTTMSSSTKLFGTLVSSENSQISTKVMAPVSKILVESGSRVRTGDPLIELDDRQLKAYLAQAEANITVMKQKQKSMDGMINQAAASLKQTEATIDEANASLSEAKADLALREKSYFRTKQLLEAGAISQAELDRNESEYVASKEKVKMAEANVQKAFSEKSKAEAAVKVAIDQKSEMAAGVKQSEAAYEVTNVDVKDAVVRAPYDGIIVDTLIDVGDMASPGMPLVLMESSAYSMEIHVDERKKSLIKIGADLPVTIEALNKTVTGKVTEISPRIDQASRTFRIKIGIPSHPNVASGMFGYVDFPDGAEKTMYIPKLAVYEWSQLKAVYVVDDKNIAHLRYVELGKENGTQIEILSGLEEGEQIITSNIEKVADQTKVVTSS